jgi:hypothetical protein
LILLDGAPLFNPYHLGGVFAAVDPDAVATVDVLSGALPAGVGDRLSGAVSIWTRDGGRDRMRSHGALGLVSSRAGVGGPLPGGRGSYLISARRTYLDLFTDAAYSLGLIRFTLPYAFTDAHLKLTHDVGARGRLSASVYVNDEHFRVPRGINFPDHADWGWGSRAVSLHYRQPIGATLLAEARAAMSTFGAALDSRSPAREDRPSIQTLRAHTVMRDVLMGVDLTHHGRKHQIRTGLQVDRYLLRHDVENNDSFIEAFLLPTLRRIDRPFTLAAYVEDEWAPNDAIRLRAGVRVLHARDVGTAWMPRLGGRFALSPELAVVFGAGRYAQAIHTMRDEESVWASLSAYDLLVGASPDVGLPLADDAVLGLEWASGKVSVRANGYIKRMRNLALASLAPDPLRASVLTSEFRRGEGAAHGMEVLAHYQRGEIGMWASYALARAEHRVDGELFPPRWERRHTLDILGAVPLGAGGQASARLVWATGQPFTPAVGILQGFRHEPLNGGFTVPRGSGGSPVLLGEHNSARLPGYLRLDVGARKNFERQWFGRKTTITPFLQVLNVLNTRNALWAVPSLDGSDPRLKYTPQFPFLPTFGIEWKF